jgi:chemotaxis protein CheZ
LIQRLEVPQACARVAHEFRTGEKSVSDDSVELDALFDEVAAQSALAQAPMALTATPMAQADQVPQDELPMYDCLGGIVRQLHDALRELGYDRAIADVVNQVSDSQNRLEYIAALTEQAANKVLNAVDESLPIQEAQALAGQQLHARWQSMFAGELSLDEFKQLAHDASDFAASTASHSEAEKTRLLSIMMAQDFQDITGQIIKKVVTLAQQLEKELAQLLRDYAPGTPTEKPVDLLSGPDTPASALVQNDVDNLLSELGF